MADCTILRFVKFHGFYWIHYGYTLQQLCQAFLCRKFLISASRASLTEFITSTTIALVFALALETQGLDSISTTCGHTRSLRLSSWKSILLALGWATFLLDRQKDITIDLSSAGGNSSLERSSQGTKEGHFGPLSPARARVPD